MYYFNIIVQKFYKEACNNDTECYGAPISMVCKKQICECTEGHEKGERFVGERGTQPICVSCKF